MQMFLSLPMRAVHSSYGHKLWADALLSNRINSLLIWEELLLLHFVHTREDKKVSRGTA